MRQPAGQGIRSWEDEPILPIERIMKAVRTRGTSSSEAMVILVHGTYAADATDMGDAWWQVGSPVWKALAQRLPPGTRLADVGETFHWSGENSERERIRAGRALLDYLLSLEDAGRPYHLVGHSHGGSVIWHALRLARKRRRRLRNLQSWTTVGTPFLHYRIRSAWSIANLFNAVLAVLLLQPALVTFHQLFRLIAVSLFGAPISLHLQHHRPGPITQILQAPFKKLLELLGVPLVETSAGLQIGSYQPGSDQSLSEFLLHTREGWLVIAVALLSAFVFLNLARLLLAPVLESLYHRADRRVERKLIEQFGDRWLALWSRHDEAINGLRATLDLTLTMLPRMTVREPILFSDHLSVLARPYEALWAPVYNWFLRPLFNRWISSSVVRAAQGANRPAAQVIAVSPTPVFQSSDSASPPLPQWLDERLVQFADDHARQMAPQLRRLLAETSIVTGIDAFAETLTGKELVHTSYFEHEEILDLVALNVAWGVSTRTVADRRLGVDPRLWEWFLHSKAMRGPIPRELAEMPRDEPPRIRPRRRHRTASVSTVAQAVPSTLPQRRAA